MEGLPELYPVDDRRGCAMLPSAATCSAELVVDSVSSDQARLQPGEC